MWYQSHHSSKLVGGRYSLCQSAISGGFEESTCLPSASQKRGPRQLCLFRGLVDCFALLQADMVNHKDKLDLVLSLNNRYTHFLVHSREALLRTMKVCCPVICVSLQVMP